MQRAPEKTIYCASLQVKWGEGNAAIHCGKYRRDVCFHRARLKAASDTEAKSEAPTVAAHTNAGSYKVIEQTGEILE
jgi:hypothetical protein